MKFGDIDSTVFGFGQSEEMMQKRSA